MLEGLLGGLALLLAVAVVLLALKLKRSGQTDLVEDMGRLLEEKHRHMLNDLHEGLTRQGDRLGAVLNDSGDRLRTSVGQELGQTRESMQALAVSQADNLAQTREAVTRHLQDVTTQMHSRLETMRTEILATLTQALAEQGKVSQEMVQNTIRSASQAMTSSMDVLTKTVESRLEQINGKVTERLDEGFKKTNETFVSVMARLATIDEAQKKIDGLTTNVVSLQELLGDKRSRGAFGEVQLDALVRNILPQQAYAMQHTFENGNRVDCALFLPQPTGTVGVDSKFPLENYHRMFAADASESDRTAAQRQFKADCKKHIDDISSKYIIPDVTSDGAVMFVPAEAVFAEIHGYHADVVEYAMKKRVWIVSPTTLMAILNTARAVIKDVETRKQIHIIKEHLGKLGEEFGRFDKRMKALADHIRLAHEDAEQVATTSKKISSRFTQIEKVELGPVPPAALLGEVEED